MKQDRYIRNAPGSFHLVKAKILQAPTIVLIFSQIALTLFWMLASDTQLLITMVLQKYPLVDESPLSLPLAQGASVLCTFSKGYKMILLPIGGGVCCVCLAIDSDSPPSLEVHGALPPVCTQRKIKLAFPCLWNFMLTDLSGMSPSSLRQPLVSQACWVTRLTSYCTCIQTDYKFTTLPPFGAGYYLWQMRAIKRVHFFPSFRQQSEFWPTKAHRGTSLTVSPHRLSSFSPLLSLVFISAVVKHSSTLWLSSSPQQN